jgi:uncharacterized integral membrane protein
MHIHIVFLLIFAIIVTLFAIFNAAVVTVSFFFVEIQISLALVIIGSTLIGAVFALLFDSVRRIKANKVLKELNKHNETLKSELVLKNALIEKQEASLVEKEDMIQTLKRAIDAPVNNILSETVDQ